MRGDTAQRSDPRRDSERPGQPAREVTDARSAKSSRRVTVAPVARTQTFQASMRAIRATT